MSDVVIPRELTLPLTNGRSLTVWAELNHGQYIAMLSRMYTESKGGELKRDVLKTTDATVIAYLIDWTLTDPSGARIPVRGLPPDDVQDALNNLRQATALEVKRAIEAHHATVEAAGEALKKNGLYRRLVANTLAVCQRSGLSWDTVQTLPESTFAILAADLARK